MGLLKLNRYLGQMLIGDAWYAIVADDEGAADAATVRCNEHALLLGVDAHKFPNHGGPPQPSHGAHKGQWLPMDAQH